MQRHFVLLGASVLIGGAGVGCQHMGGDKDHDRDDNEMTVSMEQVPAAVKASFEKSHPGATVKEIEKETHADGSVHYEFEFMHDGKAGEVEMDDKGAMVAEDDD